METSRPTVVRLGLLGCGTVGAALVELITRQRDVIAARTGVLLEVTRVAVRDLGRSRGLDLPDDAFTLDAASVVSDPSVDVVVEVMGGLDPAGPLIRSALAAGRPVITANKELLAAEGPSLYAAADAAGVDLLFEAAVAGGIPVVRTLRESLRGEPVHRVMGIINGTTNFILSQMTDEGADYGVALAEAQRLGYAESDPTADVEGYDAGAKAAILATLAFGVEVVASDVYHEGISSLTASDIATAGRLGYVVKLLGIAEQDPEHGDVAVRVHPAMVPVDHPLASVRGSYNAVFVEGGAVGSLMLYGRGAGGEPTASAVLGDVIDAAQNRIRGTHGSVGSLATPRIRGIGETEAEYLLSLEVADEPGVLHAVTGIFADHGVSIRVAEQVGIGSDARLVFITHVAAESAMQATVVALRGLDVVHAVSGVLRVIGN